MPLGARRGSRRAGLGALRRLAGEPEPDAGSIGAVRGRAKTADLTVIGTIDAHRLRSQLDLVDAVVATGTPTIAVAMRGPWDVGAIPARMVIAYDVPDRQAVFLEDGGNY